MPYHILNNIRVIDASTGIAGPYAGRMLADYGAEVFKLELHGVPDNCIQSALALPLKWSSFFMVALQRVSFPRKRGE